MEAPKQAGQTVDTGESAEMTQRNQSNPQHPAVQPGQAWVDKPLKVDGLTEAEAFMRNETLDTD